MVALLALAACAPEADRPPPAAQAEAGDPAALEAGAAEEAAVIRIAVYNLEDLDVARLNDVGPDGAGRDPAARAAAAIVQRVRPDVLVLNEIVYDHHAADPLNSVRRFNDRYLAEGAEPIDYQHGFAAVSNTGISSGFDLDQNGRVVRGPEERGTRAYAGDAWGWGTYPGQYAMALLSKLPIDRDAVRTFQHFLWHDLPGNHLPEDYYGPEIAAALRLSSKSHWDVPLVLGGRRLHLWISHPTPPTFDGPDDRNGRRNSDEIGFWRLYLEGSDALYDDQGRHGGYASGEPFVIAGDLNSDPTDPPTYEGVTPIDQILGHQRIQDPASHVTSRGAAEHRRAAIAAARAAGEEKTAADLERRAHPERATADWLGGRRVDYLLPSAGLDVVDGGVWWPALEEDAEGHALAEAASDHRLVWLDVRVPGVGGGTGS